MKYTIQNGRIQLTANSKGGELWSLCRDAGGSREEFLWCGNSQIWPRRAPVCFPWCGKLEDDYFKEGNDRYQAPPHGFVRDLEHELVDQTDISLRFRVEWPGDETLWPWHFSFETCHELTAGGVRSTFTVKNLDKQAMPFQFGCHPGFAFPFSGAEAPEHYAVRFLKAAPPYEERVILLRPELFAQGRVLFERERFSWIQLESANTGAFVRLDTSDYPYTLLWSKPNLPGFLCIEAWTGISGPTHQLRERPGTQMLPPGGQARFTQKITVSA